MKIYHDILKSKQKIIRAINTYGFSPEHNYYNYLYTQNSGKKCVFIDFGGKKGIVAFFSKDSNSWRIINGVLAPENERTELLAKFLDYASSRGSKKVFMEAAEDFKSEIFKKLKAVYRLNVNYSMNWPIYNLKKLDENLSGKNWKKLRNIKNRFYKSFKIEIKNPKKVRKEVLKEILDKWMKKRFPRDRANYSYYVRLIDNNFKGLEALRAISVNGEVCSFSGGWMVPDSEIFYCGVGIFNYGYKDLGDFVNLDDLLHLKQLGYSHVDLGGSEESLFHFKKKFDPEKVYRTYVFSITKK